MENVSTNGDWTTDYQGDNQILKILPVQNMVYLIISCLGIVYKWLKVLTGTCWI